MQTIINAKETAQTILAFLAENGQASRSDISSKLFNRHKRSVEIDKALALLLADGTIQQTDMPRLNNGRAAKVYTLCAKKQEQRWIEAITREESSVNAYAARVRKLQDWHRKELERMRHRL